MLLLLLLLLLILLLLPPEAWFSQVVLLPIKPSLVHLIVVFFAR
jgi:hypothetical protein